MRQQILNLWWICCTTTCDQHNKRGDASDRGVAALVLLISVRENVVSHSKNVKSHVFWILKKNVKNVKKRA